MWLPVEPIRRILLSRDPRNSTKPRLGLVPHFIITLTFVASATALRARSDDDAIPLCIVEGGATKLSARPVATRRADEGCGTISALVVVEDGQASTSSSCLDLASQAPSANVTVIMKWGT